MLKSLNILNFAVVDRLLVNFRPGLNVLTGETGSGKSIIVDAMTLLVGGRASSAQIRTGEPEASVEGVFEFAEEKRRLVDEALAGVGLESCERLIIRREILLTGRGRCFINGKSVANAFLKKLQPFLSEIYGQGEQRSLLSAQTHRELLDQFGQCASLRNALRGVFLTLKTQTRELRSLVENTLEHERTRDFIQHQLAEIESIRPGSGEDEELQAERRALVHAERITELCSGAYNELYESDESILAKLSLIRRQIEELVGYIGKAETISDPLLSAIASLTEVADILRKYGSGLEYSPGRLAEVESRLAELEKLKRKYGKGLDEILKMQDELASKISTTDALIDRMSVLKVEIEALRNEYIALGARLTACRCAAARALEEKVVAGLEHVAMGGAKFLVSIETSQLEDEEAVEEPLPSETIDDSFSSAFFSPNGSDYIEFLFSPNPGEVPRPLSYVASGGELSRLMLTLRTVSHKDKTMETIVFDEIDAGIGGRVAEAVGQRLKELSSGRQVFCVTHQAQIAKFADHHYVVTKTIEDERTITSIKSLSVEERISELSRMIGGDEKADKTRDAAKWLLENAKTPRRRGMKKP